MKPPWSYTLPEEYWRSLDRAKYKEVEHYLRLLRRTVHQHMEENGAYIEIDRANRELAAYGQTIIFTRK